MYQTHHGPTLIDRLLRSRFALAAGLMMAVATSAYAVLAIDELAVQGGSSTGGDAYTLVGQIGGELRFSVTGNFNNTVELFRSGENTPLFSRTIRDVWNGVTPIEIVSKQQLPDGRSRILLRVTQADASLNGGRLRLRSGNVEIDSDPINLY